MGGPQRSGHCRRKQTTNTKISISNAYLGSDSELKITLVVDDVFVWNGQEGLIQITMVASCQDSNAEYTSPNIPPPIYLSQRIPILVHDSVN